MNDEKTVLTAAKQYAWDFAQHTIHNTAETKAAADSSLAALQDVIAKLGQPAASEAGAVPVAWRYWNHEHDSWAATGSKEVAEAYARENGRLIQALFAAAPSAPPAQPEKQAERVGDEPCQHSEHVRPADGVCVECGEVVAQPEKQAGQIGDAAQSLPKRAAMIEAACHAGFQFWKMADGKCQLRPLIVGTAFAAPPAPVQQAAPDAEPIAYECTHNVTGQVHLSREPLDDLPYNREKWTERALVYAALAAAKPEGGSQK